MTKVTIVKISEGEYKQCSLCITRTSSFAANMENEEMMTFCTFCEEDARGMVKVHNRQYAPE